MTRRKGLHLGAWILLCVVALAASCKRRSDELAQDNEGAKEKPLPALSVTDDTPDLLLTWIDGRGDAHVAKKPADVAPEGRERVRVVVTTREDGTRSQFYVANLTSKNPDGSYPIATMPRTEWDALIAQRRQAFAAPAATDNAADEPETPPSKGTTGARPVSFTVIVYGASWCGACHQAVAYLKQHKVPVIEKD